MAFDKVVKKFTDDSYVTYGFIFGNQTIVFIKAGAFETHEGKDGKYLKMAQLVHNNLGATVICSSNHEESIEMDERAINFAVKTLGCNDDFKLSFVGVSDGAYQNLDLAKRFKQTKKILSINASYVTISGLIAKLNDVSNVENIFVFGENDEDLYPYKSDLYALCNDKFKLMIVKRADHKFTGMTEKLIKLVTLL